MREYMLAVSIIGLLVTALSPVALSQSSQDSTVNVDVDNECKASIYDYEQPGRGEIDPKIIGKGQNGYFTGTISNVGNQNFTANVSINIYRRTNDSYDQIEISEGSKLGNFTFQRQIPYQTINENETDFEDFMTEYKAQEDPGNYSGEVKVTYDCKNGSTKSISENRTFEIIEALGVGEGDRPDDVGQDDEVDLELDTDALIEALNRSAELDMNSTEMENASLNLDAMIERLNRSSSINSSTERMENSSLNTDALIEELNMTGQVNSSTERTENSSLNTDALVDALNQSSDIDSNTTEMENASLNLDALIEELNRTGQVDTDVNRTENASLETDADETAEDSTPQEGDNDSPGQTPEPEPEPEPDPIPLLSVDMRPLNSTYTTPKGRFAEIGLNITNTGEETLNNLQLEPRFSEGMDWQAQDTTIGSLGVGETVNQSVYVKAGETVDAGIYQIPVYASNDENDIGNQYVNVEVTEEVFTSALNIGEAPQDIQFETGQNYSIPVLLENDGDSSLENVEIELQNTEGCGEYSSESLDQISPGESASINIDFEASSDLNECEATLVASTDSGEFAFSDMNIENVEDPGVVPQEFRFPIVASMWTLMLLAYAVLTKRYGMHNLTVKVPLVLLVVGEALILIYLSSVYYDVLPPGLLPFS